MLVLMSFGLGKHFKCVAWYQFYDMMHNIFSYGDLRKSASDYQNTVPNLVIFSQVQLLNILFKCFKLYALYTFWIYVLRLKYGLVES